MTVENRSIDDIIDKEYLGYAMYTLENRAIPSAIDGLKPTSRKILYAMINEHKGKKTKISDLGGISKYNFHHGESSAMGAAITMTSSFNNNVPVFSQIGNFGTRLVPEAAAPRYIYATLNPDFYKYFCDFEVCDKHYDTDNPEPQTYLPVIPWVLVNGVEGIAVGFASKIMPHSPVDLAKACLSYLDGKKIPKLIPTFPMFSGRVEEESDPESTGKYVIYGNIERVKRNTWVISEVPYGYDRESYMNVLIKMEENNKIEDFVDECSKSGFRFTIKLNSEQDIACSKDPLNYFKLEKRVTENYTTLDEFGKLKIFSDKSEIVKYFCDYRLKKFQDKINYDIDKVESELRWLNIKIKFIKDVSSDKLVLKTKKKAEWLSIIPEKYDCLDNEANNLLNIPMVDMTQDFIDELINKINSKNEELVKLRKDEPKKIFIEKLKAIIKK